MWEIPSPLLWGGHPYSKNFKEMPKIREIQAGNMISLTEEQYRTTVKNLLGAGFVSSRGEDVIVDNDNDGYDPNLFQDAGFVVRRQMASRGQAVLPPLSRGEQKGVLEFLASNCQVQHDTFLKVPQLVDTEEETAGLSEDQARRLHMATEAVCGNIPFAPVDNVGNIKLNVKSSEDEVFWQIQRDMNTISSNPMTADEALNFLLRSGDIDSDAVKKYGWSMVSPKVSEEARRVDPAPGQRTRLSPKEWRMVGDAWLKQMEGTMICGGILADGCGTGKTNTMLFHIAWAAERLEKKRSAGSTYTEDSQEEQLDLSGLNLLLFRYMVY